MRHSPFIHRSTTRYATGTIYVQCRSFINLWFFSARIFRVTGKLLLQLHRHRLDTDPTRHGIVTCMDTHPRRIIKLSIHNLTSTAFSSPSDVLHFYGHLNFTNCGRFRHRLVTRLTLLNSGGSITLRSVSVSSDIRHVIKGIVGDGIHAVRTATQALSCAILRQYTTCLGQTHTIGLFNVNTSHLITRSLTRGLVHISGRYRLCSS